MPVSGQKQNQSTCREISFLISKKFLNFAISEKENQSKMSFTINGRKEHEFVIYPAQSKPDYGAFYDIPSYKGKKLNITYSGNPEGLSIICQDDNINGADCLYRESNRPQIHFTPRRGWNNYPNDMV